MKLSTPLACTLLSASSCFGTALACSDDPAFASYRAHVAAAEYALRLNDVAAASGWLGAAPESHRGALQTTPSTRSKE